MSRMHLFGLLLLSVVRVSDALSVTHMLQFNETATRNAATMQPTAPTAADMARAGNATVGPAADDVSAEQVRTWARKAIAQLTPDSDLGKMLHEKGIDSVADVLAHMYLEEERMGTLDRVPNVRNWRLGDLASYSTANTSKAANHVATLAASVPTMVSDATVVDAAHVRAWGIEKVKTLTPEMSRVLHDQGPDALADLLTNMYLEEEARNASAKAAATAAVASSAASVLALAAPHNTTVVAATAVAPTVVAAAAANLTGTSAQVAGASKNTTSLSTLATRTPEHAEPKTAVNETAPAAELPHAVAAAAPAAASVSTSLAAVGAAATSNDSLAVPRPSAAAQALVPQNSITSTTPTTPSSSTS